MLRIYLRDIFPVCDCGEEPHGYFCNSSGRAVISGMTPGQIVRMAKGNVVAAVALAAPYPV